MRQHYEKAIQYVREHQHWSRAQEEVALENINNGRCSLQQASPVIAGIICDLMDEYGGDHDLPEDWWREFGDEDEVFFNM